MSIPPFISKEISLKRILKGLGISIPCTIMILVIGIYYSNLINTYLKNTTNEVLGTETASPRVLGIEQIKNELVSLIPEKYVVEEYALEPLKPEDNGCRYIYGIYPKTYSDIEKEYLSNAGLMYCENINAVILRGQVDQVKYNQTEGKWMYEDKYPLETKQYGDNLVSTVALGGSHALSNYYIVRIDNSDELVILAIPSSNRIRCETYDADGVESVKKDCVDFITSMGMSPNSTDFVPDEVYDNYYNELLEILKNI